MIQDTYSYMCGYNDALAEILSPLLEAQELNKEAHEPLQILIDYVYKLKHKEATIHFHKTENGLIPIVRIPYPRKLAQKYLQNIPMPHATFLEKNQKDGLTPPRLSGGKVRTTC